MEINLNVNNHENVINEMARKQEVKEKRRSFKKIAEERLGETILNNCGSKMWIIEYVDAHNITVQFEDGYVAEHITYQRFKNGNVKNPYDKSIFGVAYIGEGKYKTQDTNAYQTWRNMILRCCNKRFKEKHPTYKDCTVCEEWLNYQNFAKWFNENYYEINEQRMCLDKDILHKGNKIYSPDNCIIVPNNINMLFVKRDALRGGLPIGVRKDGTRFQARCNNFTGEQQYLGNYKTPKEAFNVYKEYKESFIKSIANKYKKLIPVRLYDAMLTYVVEIND